MKRTILMCLTALLLQSCMNFEEPEFVAVNSVEIKELTLSQITAAMNVTVHNPNRHSITIESADVDVIIKEAKAGKLMVGKPIQIQARADADCNFTVRISTREALRAGIRSINDVIDKSNAVKLRGTVDGRYGMFRRKLKIDTAIKPKSKSGSAKI